MIYALVCNSTPLLLLSPLVLLALLSASNSLFCAIMRLRFLLCITKTDKTVMTATDTSAIVAPPTALAIDIPAEIYITAYNFNRNSKICFIKVTSHLNNHRVNTLHIP